MGELKNWAVSAGMFQMNKPGPFLTSPDKKLRQITWFLSSFSSGSLSELLKIGSC